VIPALTVLVTRSRDAKLLMDYYWDTVVQCVPPQTILQTLADAGFTEARYEVVMPGVFCQYTAKRPRDAG
jgi:demethylmenaquinone methyltransferase/2-methoxy-6-polyprenyl-1,4-benzoquinol methylase